MMSLKWYTWGFIAGLFTAGYRSWWMVIAIAVLLLIAARQEAS